MKEIKKSSIITKILLTIFLIILLLVILLAIYNINKRIQMQLGEIEVLKKQVNETRNIKGDTNYANTTNIGYDEETENKTNINANTENDITANLDNNVTEIQEVKGAGYIARLYSDNKVKITINSDDMKTIIGGDTRINTKNKEYSVTGISSAIKKMHAGNIGTGIQPVLLLIMQDGTVEQIKIINQISDANYNLISFKSEGKVQGLTGVIDIKDNSYDEDGMSAIKENGEEIKFYNMK